MNPYVGKTINKYRIDQSLGRGAMAEVFKAYHLSLDRFVALKILHAFLAEKTDILGRFRREARHVASLNHPNIVQVYDFDIDGSLYYMVMEYIAGPTLREVIKETRARGELLPISETIRIALGIGRALAYAHRQGVLHRDIKPANVMLDQDQRVVLTDFGLAKILSDPQFTTTGAMVGTPAYMAPEQGIGQPGDIRSDIYSMGVVLYQLATGRLPFVAETPLAIVFKHVNAPLPLPRAINEEIPKHLEEIILRALAKAPADRYQTVDHMLEELARVEDESITIPAMEPPPRPPTNLPSTANFVAVSLHLVETGQILYLQHQHEFLLGRTDEGAETGPDIDLTPFHAYKQGVSRKHAVLSIAEDKTVTIRDLGSTNGTWLNGTKLVPNEPAILTHGDVIALGKLVLQALIRL